MICQKNDSSFITKNKFLFVSTDFLSRSRFTLRIGHICLQLYFRCSINYLALVCILRTKDKSYLYIQQ